MNYLFPESVLMIFCKAPVPGLVKTRLMTVLSSDEAAEVHKALSIRTLELATQSRLCPVQLWCSPTTEHAFFNAAALNYKVSIFQQNGSDLGEKMHQAFCSALNQYTSALIIGCDCPSLTEHDLKLALMALARPQSCVLSPAEDGGYVLIGLNHLQQVLFENINWGTPQVFDQTLAKLKSLNLNIVELRQQWDVDTPLDLSRLQCLDPLVLK
jgi:uncharacterized protein